MGAHQLRREHPDGVERPGFHRGQPRIDLLGGQRLVPEEVRVVAVAQQRVEPLDAADQVGWRDTDSRGQFGQGVGAADDALADLFEDPVRGPVGVSGRQAGSGRLVEDRPDESAVLLEDSGTDRIRGVLVHAPPAVGIDVDPGRRRESALPVVEPLEFGGDQQ